MTSSQRARNASSSPPLGTLKLKWMLPSPRWPNGTGRTPGTSAATAAMPCARNSGHASTGTEMSCLIEAPSNFWASDRLSRRCQSARRCASLDATTASLTRPSSMAAAIVALEDVLQRHFAGAATSVSTYQGDGCASGSLALGICASTNSSPCRGINSNAETSPPVASCRRCKQSNGRCGIAHGEEGGFVRRGFRKQPQRRCGDRRPACLRRR